MKSQFTSRKQFTAMFLHTMKLTSIISILALLCFLFISYLTYDMFDPEYIRTTGHFFDELRYDGIKTFANIAFVGAGMLNAALSFGFAWSKKQSNIVLSLGMTKSDIYFSKILGGLVPMAVAITVAGVVETLSNVFGHFILDSKFFAVAILTMCQYFAVYLLAFVLSSAVMSNSGNPIEGAIFTVILGLLPSAVKSFLVSLFWQFTHGAYLDNNSLIQSESWNWANPFIVFDNVPMECMVNYFEPYNPYIRINISFWSGTIMATIYAVVIVFLGYLGFRKRRNEICGTWGRARGLNEIVATVVGFYAAYIIGYHYIFVGFFSSGALHGNGSAWNFVAACVAFLIAHIIFKLIFGYKRKKELRSTINRFPVYAMGFAAVFMVFSLGLFGYSSKIPDVKEIESVMVATPYHKMLDEILSGSSEFALKITDSRRLASYPDLDGRFYGSNEIDLAQITYTDYQNIEKVIDIHESFVRDGKIKNDGEHSCATHIVIRYKLKNGSIIKRHYTESTECTTLKLLTLNDTKEFNDLLYTYLTNERNFNHLRAVVAPGELDIDKYIEEFGEDEFPTPDETPRFYYSGYGMDYLIQSPCFLFPTDMSRGYNIGLIEKELYDAICLDIKNLTTNQYYNHSQDDEIGVLSFGLSDSQYMFTGVFDDKVVGIEDYDRENFPVGKYGSTSWNISSRDIKTVVVTKQMKNTVEYLESHDLMKYFENARNEQDIKYVKLATLGELCDGNFENSSVFPIFYGAYWTAEQMKDWIEETEKYHFNYRYFDQINNEITDKNQIKKLLGEAVVFGYCASDSKVMEITYNDGSVATMMVRHGD